MFKSTSTIKKSKVMTKNADLLKKDFEKEIILQAIPGDEDDGFEARWCAARQKAGSILKPLSISSFEYNPSPLYLTKLGHGTYNGSLDAMSQFDHIKNHDLILKFKLALEQLPSITRINLYSCRSALIPLPADRQPLLQRVGMILNNSSRYQYGALSYAEYFILALRQAYNHRGEKFPAGLTVVACAGEVHDNNGKLAISGNKRPPLKESFNEVDKNCLVQINCDAFLDSYDKALLADRRIGKRPGEITEEKEGKRQEVKAEMAPCTQKTSSFAQSFFDNSKPSILDGSSSSLFESTMQCN